MIDLGDCLFLGSRRPAGAELQREKKPAQDLQEPKFPMKKLLMSADSSPETHAVGGGLAKRTFKEEAPVMYAVMKRKSG